MTLASLPLNVQKSFSLNVLNKSAEDVLESIAAYTGLGYLIEPEGVLFYRLNHEPRAPTVTSQGTSAADADGDPYVAKILVPLDDGRTVEWLIRRSELPPDLRDKRDQDLQKAFEAIRSQSGATQP